MQVVTVGQPFQFGNFNLFERLALRKPHLKLLRSAICSVYQSVIFWYVARIAKPKASSKTPPLPASIDVLLLIFTAAPDNYLHWKQLYNY